MESKFINLLDFIPKKVLCGKNQTEYPILINSNNKNHICLNYNTDVSNKYVRLCGKRKHSLVIPKYISRDNETFEVLGLLQAEMGKKNNGCLVFSNHEYQIINKVMEWFEKELKLMCDKWRWYIKVNINEPIDLKYKRKIETKIILYWLSKAKINPNRSHPKVITYVKNTRNKKLKSKDYGTLIIEHKANLLSQIIKRFVKLMMEDISNLEKEKIKCFMKGILAGESCVEIHKPSKSYSVHLTACYEKERKLYQKCLAKLGINIKGYRDYKEMLISNKKNHLELYKQKLMCLSDEKYNKFLYMLSLYKNL